MGVFVEVDAIMGSKCTKAGLQLKENHTVKRSGVCDTQATGEY